MNKRKFLGFSIFFLFLAVTLSSAARTDIQALQGPGVLRNVDVYALDSDGDINLYQGDLQLGQSGSTPSTTANTYPGLTVPIYNAAGASIPIGSVVVASVTNNTTAGWGTILNSDSLTSVLGVAYETIASGAIGDMTISGYALVLTTGTVAIGDVLVSSNPTSGSLGYAGADTTPTTGADLGVAMSVGTAAGGLTLIRLR